MTRLPELIRWFTALVRLGLPVAEGLRGTVSPEVAERLARGDSLSQVVGGQEGALVRAAEQGPAPLALLERLAETLETRQRLQRQIERALLYPRLLCLLLILEGWLLLGAVVPHQMQVLSLSGSVGLGPWLVRAGALIVTLLLGLGLLWPDALWSGLARLGVGPGPLRGLAHQALGARCLAYLLAAGRGLPEALATTVPLLGSALPESVARGEPLSRALAEQGGAELLVWAAEAGEAHGRLPEALQDAARTMELEVELRSELQLRLLEPLALLVLAFPILIVVLSFWVPQNLYWTPSLSNPHG